MRCHRQAIFALIAGVIEWFPIIGPIELALHGARAAVLPDAPPPPDPPARSSEPAAV